MADLESFEQWAGALLQKLDAGQRRRINREIGQELRRSQSRRIATQRNPDGSAYEPRKPRKALRARAGSIKRKRQRMFARIRQSGFMKVSATASEVAVGFAGRIARIARIHQYGLRDKVAPKGREVKYPQRELLGLTSSNLNMIRDALLRRLQ